MHSQTLARIKFGEHMVLGFSCLELTACLPSGAIEGAAWKHQVLNDTISGYPEDFLLACVTLLDCKYPSRCAVRSLVGLCRTIWKQISSLSALLASRIHRRFPLFPWGFGKGVLPRWAVLAFLGSGCSPRMHQYKISTCGSRGSLCVFLATETVEPLNSFVFALIKALLAFRE